MNERNEVCKLENGEILFLNGNYKEVKNQMAFYSVELSKICEKILFVDTINCINPHHPVYQIPDQEFIFKKIYCVRTPKHYDLLARLNTARHFIKRRNIGALLINSLTLVFEDATEDEVGPILRQILRVVKELTEEFGLYTIVGQTPRDSITVRQAQATLNVAKKVI